ncbi:hypothetical protein [Nocardia rhizosphaerihabitans]|uniref:Uncharacterized protein n=1 Tax=Nocardia rhizosphaerihabitans TaxID=1691570 RepID=A0ABQ2K4I8_9NOCA|nr:hypothetical protein [Nocardia rhizosphaerihabitans]GGN66066.1 hypothetical protein GCM10011610_00620 [Nocardia rhizosphaerihabitans]
MTSPYQPVDAAAHWQGDALRRIQHLAAEHRRVSEAGPQMFEDGISADQEKVWRDRLDLVNTEREHAEYAALLGGVNPDWVVQARELGYRSDSTPARTVLRQHPERADSAQEFYLDMLGLDLWQLERMASLEAARLDRINTGRWSFGRDPIGAARFGENMTALHARASVLAAAAQLTPTEGENLWGASVDGIRRVHAVSIQAYDDLALAQEWNRYARADPEPTVPLYVPPNTSAGAAVPPAPHQMLADATSALRTEIVDTVIRSVESSDLAAESTAITAVVEAALRDDHELIWEETASDTPPDRSTGAGKDHARDL